MEAIVDKHARAQWLRGNGATVNATAAALGVSKETVMRWTTAGYNDRSRATSYNWKRRNRHTCACGAEIRHDSIHCRACAGKVRTKWTPELVIAAIQRYKREHGVSPAAHDWAYADRGDGNPGLRTVCYVFGSWNQAIIAAGLAPRKPGQRRR